MESVLFACITADKSRVSDANAQLKHLLGLQMHQDGLVHVVATVMSQWRNINPYSLAISVACISGMLGLKHVNRKHFPKIIIPEQVCAEYIDAICSGSNGDSLVQIILLESFMALAYISVVQSCAFILNANERAVHNTI